MNRRPVSLAALRRQVTAGEGRDYLLRRVEALPAVSGEAFALAGRTHGLSVRDGRGHLWVVSAEDHPIADPFHGSAAGSAALAWDIVVGELGGLRPARARRDPHLGAALVLPVGADPAAGPDGDSFGLAQVLALSSWLLELPLPGDLVATAAIRPDGGLAPVTGLDPKLDVLGRWGVGIRRVLVAAGQRLPADVGRLSIVEVNSIEDAFDHAFFGGRHAGGRHRRLARACLQVLDEDDHAGVIDEIFRLAVHGAPRMLEWGTVAALASELAGSVHGDALAWRCSVAAGIARRHAGDPTQATLLSGRHLDALPTSLRLDLLAHQLQHLADCAAPDWTEAAAAADAAAELLARHTGWRETARLRGALGRLHAAWGRVDEAVTLLDAACAEWDALLAPEQAAHPLCEWLRLLGAVGREDAIDEVLRGAFDRTWRCHRTTPVSRAFLAVAAGRALLSVGCGAQARRWLDRPLAAPDHLEAIRLRLLVLLDGDDVDPARIRSLEANPAGADSLALLRLHRGEGDAVRQLPPAEVQRIRAFTDPDADLPATLMRWWRY